MIIAIGGKKGSGKDTIGNILVDKYNFKRYAFGDAVKEVSKIFFNLNDEQLFGNQKDIVDENLGVSPREIYQKIGTEFGKEFIHNLIPNLKIKKGELWINIIKNKIKNCKSNIVITDLRFKDEINMIKELNGTTLYVNRNVENDCHISETISSSFFDKIIDNNSTLNDLEFKINKIFNNSI